MLICPCDLANASAGEAAQLCRLPPVHEHSLATEDEYGIASNAVTVLEPDLVESVALSTPNLPSHFHPKLDSGRPSLFWRSPQDTLSAESAVITVPTFPASIIEQLVPVVDDGCSLLSFAYTGVLQDRGELAFLVSTVDISLQRRTPNQHSSW
jgi:hypothetical protein